MYFSRNPDESYRRLQREPDQPGNSIKLLLHRARMGEISEDKLRLAARLNHEDAREVYRIFIKRKLGLAKSIKEAIKEFATASRSDFSETRRFLLTYIIDCLAHLQPTWDAMFPSDDLDNSRFRQTIRVLRTGVDDPNLVPAEIVTYNSLSEQLVLPDREEYGVFAAENLRLALEELIISIAMVVSVIRRDAADYEIEWLVDVISQSKNKIIDVAGRYGKAYKSQRNVPRHLLSRLSEAAQIQAKGRERLWQEQHLIEMALA